MTTPSVAFVGLGYIGLPTAVVMANSGLNVIGVDVVEEKVEKINRGEIPIMEPGLEEQLQTAIESGHFRASTHMPHAGTYIIAVPTPFAENHDVDMKFIYSAAESIAPMLEGGELIVLESTSPPLTTTKLADRILTLRPDLAADGSENPQAKPILYFAHCPERILPGNALEELVTNDRIIGGMTEAATSRAADVYRSFCQGELLATNDRTAELAKLTENSFRDVNIAFANELSLICDNLGISVWELIDLANHHPRVNILQPGPGVGGHCIAVDPWFIISADPTNARLIRTAREVNDAKPYFVVDRVISEVKKLGENSEVAILGITFKADIDDLRESPALTIAAKLAESLDSATIRVVEPNIGTLPDTLSKFHNVHKSDLPDAISSSDLIVALVDHDEFKSIEASLLIGKTVIDTKGIWGRV